MKHIYCRLAHSIFFQDEWLRLRFLQGDNVSSEMDSLVIGTFNNVNYRVSVRYAGVLPLKLIPIFDWRVDVRINEQTLRRRMFKTTSHSVVINYLIQLGASMYSIKESTSVCFHK